MAMWGAEVKSGKEYVHTFSPSKGRLRITRATLGNPNSLDWCFLEARVGQERKATLCVLHPNSKPTCGLEIELEEDESVTFSVKGKSSIHLSGYYTQNCTVTGPTLLKGIDQEMPHRNNKKARRDDFASNTDHENGDEERNGGNEKINATPTLLHHKKKVTVVKKSSGTTTSTKYYDISDDEKEEDVLIEETITKGQPDAKVATNGCKVRIGFVGCLKDGKVFDNDKRHQFRLGAGKVVAGWEIGIRGMRVGEKKKLIIPPSLGYGDRKQEKVPANSWLIYTIELLEVEEAKRTSKREADA